MSLQPDTRFTPEHLDQYIALIETKPNHADIYSYLTVIETDLTEMNGKYDLRTSIAKFVKIAENHKAGINDYIMHNNKGQLFKFLLPYTHLFNLNVKILAILHKESKATDLIRCKLLEECIAYMDSSQKFNEIWKSVVSLILEITNSFSVLRIAERNQKTFNELLRQAANTPSARDFYLIFANDAEFLDIDVKCTYYGLKNFNCDPNSLMELLTGCLARLETSQRAEEIFKMLTTLFALFKDKTIDTRLAQKKFIQIATFQKEFVNRYLMLEKNPDGYNMLKSIPDLLDVHVTEKYFDDVDDDSEIWNNLSTYMLYLSSARDVLAKKPFIDAIELESSRLRDRNQAALMEFAENHKITINDIHRQNVHQQKLGGILTYYPQVLDDDLLIRYLKIDMPAPTETNIKYMLTVCLRKLKTSRLQDKMDILLPAIDRLLDAYKFEVGRIGTCLDELVDFAKNNRQIINSCITRNSMLTPNGLIAILSPYRHIIDFDNRIKYIDIVLKKLPRDLKWAFLLECLESIEQDRDVERMENIIFKIKRSLYVVTNEGYQEFAESHQTLINKILYQHVRRLKYSKIFDLIKDYQELWSMENKIKFASELVSNYDENTKWQLVEKCLEDPKQYTHHCVATILTNMLSRNAPMVDEEKLIEFIEKYPTIITETISISNISPHVLPYITNSSSLTNFADKIAYLHNLVNHPGRIDNAIEIDRNDIVISSFTQTSILTENDWKRKFVIKFVGEDGVDCGGISREWFTILTREMFNPNYVLFTTAPGDPNSYMINKASHVNPEHLDYFGFFGRIIAKSIVENQRVHCNFTKSFYKQILDIPVELSDLESQDPVFFKSMYFMLKQPTEQLNMDLTFSTEVEEFGETIVKDLVDNGRNIPVTDENKEEYVKFISQMKMTESIKEKLEAFRRGFNSIIPHSVISIFTPDELEILIAGQPNIDVNNLEANTVYNGYEPTDEHILWFWRALKSFNTVERSKFLMFTTGSPNAPLHGFGALLGSTEVQKFTISKDDRDGNRLPTASTCMNRLSLPQYDSYSSMRAALLTAIEEGTEGFYVT